MAPGGLGLALLVLGACGCTAIAGLDGDYTVAPATGSGGGGTGASGNTASSSGSAMGGSGIGGSGVAGEAGTGGSGATGGSGGSGPLTWQVVDTLTIDCATSASVTSSVTLMQAETYRLRASGSCFVTAGVECDAEWMDFNNPHTLDNNNVVDMGLGVDDPTADGSKTPDWGPYGATHVYTTDFVGKGAPIQVNFHDPNYTNNNGGLTVEVLRYQ